MKKYNYYEEVKNDVLNYINENEISLSNYEDLEDMEETLRDTMWAVDSVTGNASGSYTFNRLEARGYVVENLELLSEACSELCIPSETVGDKLMDEEWEWMDVIIRCYVLDVAISDALEEIEK